MKNVHIEKNSVEATLNSMDRAYHIINSVNNLEGSSFKGNTVMSSGSGSISSAFYMDARPGLNCEIEHPRGTATVEGTQNSDFNDFLLTGTASTDLSTYHPGGNETEEVGVFYRVVTGSTTVTIAVAFTDWSGTAQTITLVNAVVSAVGAYSVGSVRIPVGSGYDITVKATASVANQVYVSSWIRSAV